MSVLQPKKDPSSKENKSVFRAHFLRVFGKYDIRNEEQFIFFGKMTVFIVLVTVELFVLLGFLGDFHARGGWQMLAVILFLELVLTLSEALKFFVVKSMRARIPLYVIDALIAASFTLVVHGASSIILYMLVLTEFYLVAEQTRPCLILLISAMALYIASYILQAYLLIKNVVLMTLLTDAFSYTFAMVLHFLFMQVALAFYRQFIRLDKTLKELAESKKELEKAYEVVAEVTVLEERQRIAKEIHDTAGHSLTTVIMQTEAAKLILDKNPEEAKYKIVAANLQAKHALEELRDSVHLLSGIKENQTLQSALQSIIHESTDGTGIIIRSEIEEIEVVSAKFRFLCNTLKEGISNGLRHGGATAFWFELKKQDGKIVFLLSDNGKGVPEGGLKTGFGLTSMIDRAKSLGGEVVFAFDEGEGFEIRLTLPLG